MVRIMDFQDVATSGVTMDFSKQKKSKLSVILLLRRPFWIMGFSTVPVRIVDSYFCFFPW